jgi:hypothetical protein
MNTTTRWTAPEPTGLDKMFQDKWDERRDTQVRTYMTLTSQNSFANFEGAVMRGIAKSVEEREKARAEGAEKGGLIWTHICGSYDRTDKPERNDPIDVFLKQMGSSSKSPLTKILNRNNLVIGKKGCYSTGTLHFDDGTMEVIDPTKGFQYDSSNGRKLVDMKPIETIYCWILAVV